MPRRCRKRAGLTLRASQREAVCRSTLDHYRRAADAYWQGTRDYDQSKNYDDLLRHLDAPPPQAILDLGCGPGRDLAHFRSLGLDAVGLDGCERFVELARAHSGCEVLCQDFARLSLPRARFDGVFANASLFHVPRLLLPDVIVEVRQALRPRGVLFTINPHGDDEEGWLDDRFAWFASARAWCALVTAAGFSELCRDLRREGNPRSEQMWLATTWRRRE